MLFVKDFYWGNRYPFPPITWNCKNLFYYVDNTPVDLWWSLSNGCHWLHLCMAEALSSSNFQISGLHHDNPFTSAANLPPTASKLRHVFCFGAYSRAQPPDILNRAQWNSLNHIGQKKPSSILRTSMNRTSAPMICLRSSATSVTQWSAQFTNIALALVWILPLDLYTLCIMPYKPQQNEVGRSNNSRASSFRSIQF